MATIDTTSLTRYILTEEETVTGQILNLQQQQVIQNLIAGVSEQSLNLVIEGNDFVEFIKQRTFLTGQIEVLRYLLQTSDESEQMLIEKAQNASQQ